MQKHDDTVQNLHGDVIVDAQVQVMLAGTNTPATVFSDAAGLISIQSVRTDRLGRFEFYAPNGRYDIYVVVDGVRVSRESDILIYDPEDDERVTTGGGGGGGGGGVGIAGEVIIPSVNQADLDRIDGSLGNVFVITLTGPLVLPTVKNPRPGTLYAFFLTQDITGGRAVTFDRKYRFMNNSIPTVTQSTQSVDLLEAEYKSDGFFFARIWKGYTTSSLARILSARYETMADGVNAMQTGQTLYITRSGQLTEVIAAMTKDGEYTVAGAPELTSSPQLHMDKTVRAAWGKGILNIEAGTVTVRDLWFDGAVNDVDETISGVRYNGGCKKLVMQRVKTTNCNNGQLAGIPNVENRVTSGQYNIEWIDCEFNGNGLAYQTAEKGQSHNIYLNHATRARALRCQFINAIEGHDFKTRADFVLLDRCILQGAKNARELDVPNGGIIHAVNTIFRKVPGSGQGNLIEIGVEGIEDRPQEYIFRNCVLDNSKGMNFSETWIIQYNSAIPVKFVDCVFIGAPNTVMVTPFELYYTGGPLGPEGWDQTVTGVIPKWGQTDSMAGNTPYPDAQQPVPQYNVPDPTLVAFPPTGSTATPSVRDDAGDIPQ